VLGRRGVIQGFRAIEQASVNGIESKPLRVCSLFRESAIPLASKTSGCRALVSRDGTLRSFIPCNERPKARGGSWLSQAGGARWETLKGRAGQAVQRCRVLATGLSMVGRAGK
jgi:hypothetical protein